LPGSKTATTGYEHLLKLASKGIREHIFERVDEPVDVLELLGRLDADSKRMDQCDSEITNLNPPLHIENFTVEAYPEPPPETARGKGFQKTYLVLAIITAAIAAAGLYLKMNESAAATKPPVHVSQQELKNLPAKTQKNR
jgi:hypothetical protein